MTRNGKTWKHPGTGLVFPFLSAFRKAANAGRRGGLQSQGTRGAFRRHSKGVQHAIESRRRGRFDARELECRFWGRRARDLAAREIIPSNEFYDYDAKYVSDSRLIIPAALPEETASEMGMIAKKAYLALNCAGLSRVDFLLRKSDGKVFLNEINTIPGFTSISMYPKLFAAKGLPYPELLNRLYELAQKRRRKKFMITVPTRF
jgi:D-alanine-D-alanine ligase